MSEAYSSKGESGLAAGTTREGAEESTGAVVFQLLRASSQAQGTWRLWLRPTACSSQAVSPHTPATWLSALKASVSSLVSGSRDTCGDRCALWQGEQIPGKWEGRIKCSVPKGRLQSGSSFPLLLPSVALLQDYKGILQAP